MDASWSPTVYDASVAGETDCRRAQKLEPEINALRILMVGLLLLVAAGCAQLPSNYEASETTALTDTDDTTLGIRAAISRHDQAGETVVKVLTS